MSTSKGSPDAAATRKLPSWMASRESGTKSQGNKQHDRGNDDDSRASDTSGYKRKSMLAGPSTAQFSKVMEGVVFVLSGFVNPERGTLRSQALEMGAEYQPDWNSNCTLLVCAFPNTPKFRQVEAECGTIVSKEWITECHKQRRLVQIDSYLMHAGKPWKRSSTSNELDRDTKTPPPGKPQKSEEGKPRPGPNAPEAAQMSKNAASMINLSPLKVKRWASDDFKKTISWLESQDEKPEPSEIRNIAAEGILTCLQDAIDLLNIKEDLHKLTEQWSFIPHVIEELISMEATANSPFSQSKENLHKQAVTCKEIYERELNSMLNASETDSKRPSTSKKHGNSRMDKMKTGNGASSSSRGYDSDETIEMTEEEIEQAYEIVASKLRET